MKRILTVLCGLLFLAWLMPPAHADTGCPVGGWIPNCLPAPAEDGCISHRQGCGSGSTCYPQYTTTVYKSNGTPCDADGQPGQCNDGVCLTVCNDVDGDGLCDDEDGCVGGVVAADTSSNLCWYKDTSIYSKEYDLAVAECEISTLGGYDDWRLPTLDELRGIVVDCPSAEPGGSCTIVDPTCPITESDPRDYDDEAAQAAACTQGCDGCPSDIPWHVGYAAEFLNDRRDKVWSVDTADDGNWAWVLNFRDARIYLARDYWANYLRCVRDYVAEPPCPDADGDGVCDTPGTGGPQQEIISDSTPGDSWNHHIFDVEPGSLFSVTFETHSGAAFYFVEWDQSGGFGGNQCYKYVNTGQTDSCGNLTVGAAATQAYVSVNGLQFGVDYTITVDYVAPGGTGCPDTDGDGVCDADDICPGYDDAIDADSDGTPDGCDICPLDNPDDPDGNGICGVQGSTSGCTGPGVAEDAANGLCWMYDTAPGHFNFADGTDYCNTLVLDGYDDWRLPTIDELRMIVEGCPSQEYGGSCGVTDPGCLDGTCDDVGCSPCSWGDYLAPYLAGGNETTISSSEDGSGLHWVVRYVNAYIFRRGSAASDAVRCVRDAAGTGCTDSDGDSVCDADDICPGFDDLLDADGDGTPDDCDICPFDNPDDPDGNGICGDQGSLPSCTGPNVVEDADTGLCWQDPEHTDWLTQAEAASYCDNLVLDGYDNWRLPTIGETRTIIQNCPVQQAGGACGITDSCLHRATCDAGSCSWCSPGGDYLKSSLSYRDSSQRLWSSSIDTTYGDYYSVEFFTGYIRSASATGTKNVRCVRIP